MIIHDSLSLEESFFLEIHLVIKIRQNHMFEDSCSHIVILPVAMMCERKCEIVALKMFPTPTPV